MDIVLIIVMVLLLAVNVTSFVMARKCIKKINDQDDNAEANYKKGMKYVILSIITSLISLVVITIVLIKKVL